LAAADIGERQPTGMGPGGIATAKGTDGTGDGREPRFGVGT